MMGWKQLERVGQILKLHISMVLYYHCSSIIIAFVRKGKVVKVVKLDNVWSYYYLASDGTGQSEHKMERDIKCWKYSQP